MDRKSQFVLKNARDFVAMVNSVRTKQCRPDCRGAVLCREHPVHRALGIKPFARSLQQVLLDEGHIILSIPDDPSREHDESWTSSCSDSAAVEREESQ